MKRLEVELEDLDKYFGSATYNTLPCQGHFTSPDFSFLSVKIGKQGLAKASVGNIKRLYVWKQ